MKNTVRTTSIRTRLLVAYGGILLLGFAVLTFVAGGQISSAARADYKQRLRNEIQLIAHGLQYELEEVDENESLALRLQDIIARYEQQVGGTISLVEFVDQDVRHARFGLRGTPEVQEALHDDIIVVERENEDGQHALFTAALIQVGEGRFDRAVVQLSVPIANLQALVFKRWLMLWLIFALIAGLALGATLWVSRSIIRPLVALRESAKRLSKGDFSHRVDVLATDEIGQVAVAFNEMVQQVESMLEEQRAFASNTSHELRTPLTTIRLRSEALRDDDLDADTHRQYIAEIDDEVRRLSSLIEDLTLLARFDAGRAELGESEIDMRRFASRLQQQMQAQADAKQIQLSLEMPTTPVSIHASLNHLTVVFRNVLDNAIKYTATSGQVTWSVRAGADGVECIIKDSGQGIEADQLPHLFERFYRADKAHSRDIPGTGLGLALVQSIVQAYDGRIVVESAGPQQGTTVTVCWPYRRLAVK